MIDKFFVISIGPGHPDLITIQALKALKECDIVFLPARNQPAKDQKFSWNGSVAYKILSKIRETYSEWFHTASGFDFIQNWENKFKPLYTPMNYSHEAWKTQVDTIVSACNQYKKIGFVTLGDAAIYSSAYYLLDIIKNEYSEIYEKTEIISGISSISYASALVKKPLCLGNTSLEILPMHTDEVKSTKVYMRLHKGDDLRQFTGDELYYFENIGLENEAYGKKVPEIVNNYLTLLVDFADVQKNKDNK